MLLKFLFDVYDIPSNCYFIQQNPYAIPTEILKKRGEKKLDTEHKRLLHFTTVTVASNQASRLIIYQFSGKRKKYFNHIYQISLF